MKEFDSGLLPDALRNSIAIDSKSGCWLWLGVMARGYGKVSAWRLGISDTQAHVVIYRLLGGKIPAGHGLHHNCENKRCCNPAHLNPLSKSEHMRWHVARRLKRQQLKNNLRKDLAKLHAYTTHPIDQI